MSSILPSVAFGAHRAAPLASLLAGLLLLALAPIPAAIADSQDDWAKMRHIHPPTYVCPRVDEPPRIDGKLSDKAWRSGRWTTPFVDIEGDRKPRPRFRTQVKMIWDAEHFYIGARLEEPHVWGTLTKHDSVIFHDNDFEVFIDPNGDTHEYFELELNALNTTWDLFLPKPYKNGGRADNGLELAGLRTAVHIEGTLNDPTDRDRAWSVEIAIPWKSFSKHARRPTPPRLGDTWRVNFSRVQWKHDVVAGAYKKRAGLREDNWVWSPQGIIDMHRPERWGYVQFAENNRAPFHSDGANAAREALMTIYHHQKGYFQRHKKWAADFAALQLDPKRLAEGLNSAPTLKLTERGFQAAATVVVAGEKQIWQVRQDSLLQRK